MHIKPLIGSVVGKTDELHWGQVMASPTAYGVLEIEDSSGQARDVGIAILTQLSQRVSTPLTSLQAVQRVASQTMEDGVVTVILVVPVGKVIYLVLTGEGAVYLKRGDQISCLMERPGSLSGEVKEGDTLLLVTRGFARALSPEQLMSTFDHLSPTEAAEKLTLVLHEADGGEGGAALLFQVAGFTPIEEEPLPAEKMMMAPQRRGWQFRLSRRLPLVWIKRVILGRRSPTFSSPRKLMPSFLRQIHKPILPVAAILLTLFLVSVGLGIRRELGTQTNEATVETMNEAQHAFDEGVALLDLNPVKGRQRLTEAKQLLEPLAASTPETSKFGRQLRALYQQVADRLTLAMNVVKSEPQLFYDVSLLKKGAVASSMAEARGQLATLDALGKTVYWVTISSKNGQVVGGGEVFTGASLVATHGDKVFVLVEGGVHLTRVVDKKTETLVIKKTDDWGKIGAMVAFSGNVYLLDTLQSRIWKYVAVERGFSEIREYLNPDTLPDFRLATNMAIDGSVWVGTNDGKILRFTQGREDTFVPQGVETKLGNTLVVYTSDEAKRLYVLDQENKRIVVLEKDGMYLSQYVWQGELKITQLVVSEKEKKILLLAEGKIYSLELK